MRSTLLTAALSTATFLAGCAVDASSSTTTEASTQHREPSSEITVSPMPHICYNAPLTFEPAVSCSSFSYATTPDASYASCGMTSATFATPACVANGGEFAWDVIPGGVQNLQTFAHLSPLLCGMYYADMELWTQSSTSGKWQEVASGRRYATSYTSDGETLCSPPYMNPQLVQAAGISQVTIWADAYGPELTLSGLKTVPQSLSIRASAER